MKYEEFSYFLFCSTNNRGLIVLIFMIFNNSNIPDIIEIIMNLSFYCLGSMLIGIITTGTLYCIVENIIDKVLRYIDKNKYTDILIIIFLSVISTYVFFYTGIGELAVAYIDGIDYNYTKLLYRILGAYTVPMYLLVQLIKDYTRHNKYYNY